MQDDWKLNPNRSVREWTGRTIFRLYGMFDVDTHIESTEIREAMTDRDSGGDERFGSASISLFGPKCLRGVFVEDNQSTIRILESGKSPACRQTGKTQRVNLAWLSEQFRRKHYQLVHAATARQSADICTKPFTTSEKWNNALKLINHVEIEPCTPEASRDQCSSVLVSKVERVHRGTCFRGIKPNA